MYAEMIPKKQLLTINLGGCSLVMSSSTKNVYLLRLIPSTSTVVEAVIFFSVLLATVLMSDGRSHWLKGYLLMLAYTFIAASWQEGG